MLLERRDELPLDELLRRELPPKEELLRRDELEERLLELDLDDDLGDELRLLLDDQPLPDEPRIEPAIWRWVRRRL